jgi:hypothetical protein
MLPIGYEFGWGWTKDPQSSIGQEMTAAGVNPHLNAFMHALDNANPVVTQ